MAMFRMVPPVIRGCNASELQSIVREYGDPPHDDHEVLTAKEGDDPDLPNYEPLRQSLADSVRANHRHDDEVGAVPDEDGPPLNTDLILLTGGGRSNFGLLPDPVQPNVHDFSGNWDGIVGRIVDASVEAQNR